MAEQIVLQTLGIAAQPEPDPAALSAALPAPVSAPERLANTFAALSQAEIPLTEFSLGQPSLDEVFLALTGPSVNDKTTTKKEIA